MSKRKKIPASALMGIRLDSLDDLERESLITWAAIQYNEEPFVFGGVEYLDYATYIHWFKNSIKV